jgi:putative transposase
MFTNNPTFTHLPSGSWVNKDFDPFKIDWMDRGKALKLFCYSVKKDIYPSLGDLFHIADYSEFEADSILDVLTYNAITNDSSENGTLSFGNEYNTSHPSPRTIRYRLEGLNLAEIESAFKEGTKKILHLARRERIFQNPVFVSIDITHTPFYGKRKKYVCGTKEFKGTNYGYKYASVVVSVAGSRFTLHTVPMTQFTSNADILEELITEAQKYVTIRAVLVDRGFFNVRCIRKLEEKKVKYIMPVVKHQKKFLRSLRPPCKAHMIMGKKTDTISFTIIAVRDSDDLKTILYYATNVDILDNSLEAIILMYKKRWTVENAFKTQKLAFLAKTYSIDFVMRFFFWVLATLLYNLWVLCNLTAFCSLKLDPSAQKRPLVTANLFGLIMKIMLLSTSNRPAQFHNSLPSVVFSMNN